RLTRRITPVAASTSETTLPTTCALHHSMGHYSSEVHGSAGAGLATAGVIAQTTSTMTDTITVMSPLFGHLAERLVLVPYLRRLIRQRNRHLLAVLDAEAAAQRQKK
ncbi:hypothetical protein AB0333_04670, partial [Citricoccus sp. NPDC079358]